MKKSAKIVTLSALIVSIASIFTTFFIYKIYKDNHKYIEMARLRLINTTLNSVVFIYCTFISLYIKS